MNIKNIANASLITAGAALLSVAAIRGYKIHNVKKVIEEAEAFNAKVLDLTFGTKVEDIHMDTINEFLNEAKHLIEELDALPEMKIIQMDRAIIKESLKNTIDALGKLAEEKEKEA